MHIQSIKCAPKRPIRRVPVQGVGPAGFGAGRPCKGSRLPSFGRGRPVWVGLRAWGSVRGGRSLG
eukprot:385743-Rhodomonas_salina.1